MPRFHRVDGVRIQLTAEEETARDAEEAALAAVKATADERQARIDALKAKITDGSATHAELLEHTQYSIGAR
jgi:anti-sigma28 factor (negative regulator of flagellin synthesis)